MYDIKLLNTFSYIIAHTTQSHRMKIEFLKYIWTPVHRECLCGESE